MTDDPIRAEVLLPTSELRNDLPFYTKVLGMRMDAARDHLPNCGLSLSLLYKNKENIARIGKCAI